MIDAFLQIVDRLISLRNLQTSRRKDIFKEILTPVFNDLQQIHADYLAMFEEIEREAQQKISRGRKPEKGLKQLRNTLKAKRIQFEPVRIKLKEFIRALEKEKLQQEEKEFIYQVIWYFPEGSLRVRATAATAMVDVIDNLLDDEETEYLDDTLKLHMLTSYISITINHHKHSWSGVCEKYAKLKIAISKL